MHIKILSVYNLYPERSEQLQWKYFLYLTGNHEVSQVILNREENVKERDSAYESCDPVSSDLSGFYLTVMARLSLIKQTI